MFNDFVEDLLVGKFFNIYLYLIIEERHYWSVYISSFHFFFPEFPIYLLEASFEWHF